MARSHAGKAERRVRHGTCVLDQLEPGGSHGKPTRDALEQHDAELFFERGHLTPNRRLRCARCPRRRRKRTGLSGREEGSNLVPIEPDVAPIHAGVHSKRTDLWNVQYALACPYFGRSGAPSPHRFGKDEQMQAVTSKVYGGPEVLEATEVARPSIKPNEILVRVHASAVTEGDRRIRAADFPGVSAVFGRLLMGLSGPRRSIGGSNFAGRVVQVGQEVTGFAVGDDVFGGAMHGAYAEYLAVPSSSGVAKLPHGVTYAEAAAIPYGGVTALVFLRDMAQVRPGERVLIVGASGGVGRMAVQLAKHLGAHVTGVCGEDAELVRALGADDIIDYRHEDFTQRAERWDVIFDTTQGNHFRAYRSALTRTGRYLSLYVTVRLLGEMIITKLRGGPRALTGVAMGDPQLTDQLRELVARGALRAVIARRYPLAETARAHAFLESQRPHGSVVIDVVETTARSLERATSGSAGARQWKVA